MVATAGPGLAVDDGPAVDINTFLPADFIDLDGDAVPEKWEDTNGDGVPDIPDGIHGIWDDTVGAKTPAEFLDEVDIFRQTFDFDDTESMMIGPCGGLAISYDGNGNSLDAIVDKGDSDPVVDVFSGEQGMTRSNPMLIDSDGFVAYYGFTRDVGSLSLAGTS